MTLILNEMDLTYIGCIVVIDCLMWDIPQEL